MLSYALKTVTDTYFLGKVGQSELAAVALGGVISFTFLAFGIGTLRAVKVLGAQAAGASNHDSPTQYLGSAIWVSILLSIVTIISLALISLVTPIFASTEKSGILASHYVVIRGFSSPFVFLFCAVREFSYAQDDTRSPMIASVIANLFNIVADYFFVMVWGFGVDGAAWATVLSCFVEALLMLYFKRSSLSINRERARIKRLLKVGLPLGIHFSLDVTAFTFIAAILSFLSEQDVAAHHIVLQIVHLSFLPALAIGEGASILVGQAIGARQTPLVFKVYRSATIVASAYTGMCTILFVLLSREIVSLFAETSGKELIDLSQTVLYIGCCWLVLDGFYIIQRSVLRGVGDVAYVAKWGIVIIWGVTVTLTLLLGLLMGYGVIGAWFGLMTEVVISVVFFGQRLFGQKWADTSEQVRSDAIQ